MLSHWRTAMNTKLLGRPVSHLSFGGSSFLIFQKTFNTLKPQEFLFAHGLLKVSLWISKDWKLPCTPISHCSDALLLVCYNKNYGPLRELPVTSKTRRHNCLKFTKPRWIPKCTNCNWLSHQQAVHIHHSLQAATIRLCAWLVKEAIKAQKGPFQISMSCGLQRRHHWFGIGQASQPFVFKEKHKGILNSFQPSCKLSVLPY